MAKPRTERRTENTATTALLLVVLVLASAGSIGPDRPGLRHVPACGHGVTQVLAGGAFSEPIPLPGAAHLVAPSDTRGTVGNRAGADVAIDLAHLAGSTLERQRRLRDLPPPHRG